MNSWPRAIALIFAALIVLGLLGTPGLAASSGSVGRPSRVDDPTGGPDKPDTVRAELVEQLIPIQAQLRESFGDTFAGLWIDEDRVPHVAVVGDQTDIEATLARVPISPKPVLEAARFSEAQLADTMKRISSALETNVAGDRVVVAGLEALSIELSLQRNGIVVKRAAGSPGRTTAPIDVFGSAIIVEESDAIMSQVCSSRSNCGAPLKAGFQLYKNLTSKACMSAFVMQDDHLPPHYFLTSAGHCWDAVYTTRYHPTDTNIGSSSGQYHPVVTPVDVGRVPNLLEKH